MRSGSESNEETSRRFAPDSGRASPGLVDELGPDGLAEHLAKRLVGSRARETTLAEGGVGRARWFVACSPLTLEIAD